jgi:hypothetical protein
MLGRIDLGFVGIQASGLGNNDNKDHSTYRKRRNRLVWNMIFYLKSELAS